MAELLVLEAPDLGVTFSTSVLKGSPKMGCRANWAKHKINNRAAPVIAYDDSDAITFSFTSDLFAIIASAKEEVADISKSLFGLVKPINAGVKPPSVCYLTYPAFGLEGWMCVVESVDVSNPSDIWSKDDSCAMHAEVSISLTEIDLWNVDAAEYLALGGGLIAFNLGARI